MQRPGRASLLNLIAVLALLAGCATTTPGSSVIKTLYSDDTAAPFVNVLVISVAGDIPTRVQFEQQLAAAISTDEHPATAFYTVVGRNPQLTRGILQTAIQSREFDAVILTRVKGQDRADLATNRPTGRNFDLFLYDYAELNIPAAISVGSTVSFVVEIYDAATSEKIWAIESLVFDADNIDSVIAEQLAAISAEILKDGMVQL